MSNFSEFVEWVNEDENGNRLTAHGYMDSDTGTVEVEIGFLDALFRKYGYERKPRDPSE